MPTQKMTTGQTAKGWKALRIMKSICKGYRYEYLIAEEDGTIYRKSKKGIEPVKKRFGQRGYLEFKMNDKTVLYHQIVAKMLVPNPKGGNLVFFRSKDYSDVRPENLRWVWSRQGQTLTPQQAIDRSKDRDLIAYYRTGNPEVLESIVLPELKKIWNKELIGEVYRKIHEYANRCLLFNIRSDVRYLAYAENKYSKKRRIKTVQLFEKYT